MAVLSKNKMIKTLKKKECIIDCHTHVGMSLKEYLSGSYPYAMSFEDLVIRMKKLGISHSAVFPYGSSYYLRKTMDITNEGSEISLSAFPYEKENIRLFEEIYSVFPQYADMAMPFLRFDPSDKVDEQVELFEKLIAEYPVYGMKTVTTYCKSFVNDFDGKGSALKEFARKYDLPVTFHSSWHKDDIWANVFDIIAIAKNNPDLRICLAHTGRFCKEILESAAKMPNCFIDTSALKIHCDLALANDEAIPCGDERFETDYSFPGKVLSDLAVAYPDTIIWGSDTPANYFFRIFNYSKDNIIECKLKSTYDSEILALNALKVNDKRKVSYENTLNFLFGEANK
jgi:predicted TIM-barrel fold metal-dependent hydrolase